MLAEVAGQRLNQLRDFGRIRALAIPASTCASRSPSINAASIARPDTPRMSVATDDSLMDQTSSSLIGKIPEVSGQATVPGGACGAG